MAENLPATPHHEPPIQPLFEPSTAATRVNYEQPIERQPDYQPQAEPRQIQQPVPVRQPAAAVERPPAPEARAEDLGRLEPQITLISHSSLFYWWPVWAVGYALAAMTDIQGQAVQLGQHGVNIHPSNNLGVFFFLTLFVVILISNVVVRGLASALVIMGIVLATVFFAYMGWWDTILGWVSELTIYLNQGAYFWFSTLIFLVWAATTFVFDRMSYWRVRPGQMTHEFVFGSSERSYDTQNMSFEKRRDDVFRHWLLGMGSGDLTINAFNGGHPEEIHIPNVLFIGMKIRAIQEMIAMRPTEIQNAQPVVQRS